MSLSKTLRRLIQRPLRALVPVAVVLSSAYAILDAGPSARAQTPAAAAASTDAGPEPGQDANANANAEANTKPEANPKAEAKPAPKAKAAEAASRVPDVDWDKTKAGPVATAFLELLKNKNYGQAYAAGSQLLREARPEDKFAADIQTFELDQVASVEWTNGIVVSDGFRLDGSATLSDGSSLPLYAIVLGDTKHDAGEWLVLDIEPSQSFVGRILGGRSNGIDALIAVVMVILLGAFFYIVWSYARGLKGSPRELYLLFFTKVTEYSAYGAANMTFILYLHSDVGLGDVAAGSYVAAWSMLLTILTMGVGAVCDAIGVKKTLLIGCYAFLFSRFLMPFMTDPISATLFGFIPLAIGIAITGPVLSAGIKLFTTRSGAALGFGLFYTLMNVGWAIGAWIFDTVRGIFGDNAIHTIPGVGLHISTYQIIIAVGFFLTLPDLIAISFIRDGVEMTEKGVKIHPKKAGIGEGPLLAGIWKMIQDARKETTKIFVSVFKQRSFWVYLFMLAILIPVRQTFYHFHYTFPPYALRVFGSGVKIGSIFGVLNPVLIVFLVPIISATTAKIRSYKMMLIGTTISALSVFLAVLPPETMVGLTDSWFGTVIYERWLEIPFGRRDPFYLSLIIFIIIFTIGESIWSPRLMQFSAEIAPRGREGSYIALSYLPNFLAKFFVGPMSGWLVATYTPENATSYPNHYMVWIWIGGTAMLSPIGLVLFRSMFRKAEDKAIEEAEAAAAEEDAAAEQATGAEPATAET